MIRSVSFNDCFLYIIVSYTPGITSPKIFGIFNTETKVREKLDGFGINNYEFVSDTNFPNYLKSFECFIWILKVTDTDMRNGIDISSSKRLNFRKLNLGNSEYIP